MWKRQEISDKVTQALARWGIQTPVVLLGSQSWGEILLALPEADRECRVLAVVDDRLAKDGFMLHGIPVITSADFSDLANVHADLIPINTCVNEAPKQYFDSLCQRNGLTAIDFVQLVELFGLQRKLSGARPFVGPAGRDAIDQILERDKSIALSKHILVADCRFPDGAALSDTNTATSVAQALAEMSFDVTLIKDDAKQLSVRKLDARGASAACEGRFESLIEFIRKQGHDFGTFYLMGARIDEAIFDAIRNVAPQSRIISHAPASTPDRDAAMPDASRNAMRASLVNALDAARAFPLALMIDYFRNLTPPAVPASDQHANIDVSIIVPVYNQWHMTRACLNSILETTSGSDLRYELILADDGSTDDTANAEKIYPGLKVVKTERNVGFLRNCNNAARSARGRHILLLNNDTIVLPGWLETLCAVLDQDASVAIAGSKMLYPDGLIQEAGALLFRDGTAKNLGRGAPRDTRLFDIEREVDYISGCSILVRKSFWDAVGGFDERYKSAYCEDSDLAMTARSRGMKVIYQPRSEIIHFEHASYGDQTALNLSVLQEHNIRLLRDKWGNALMHNHPVAM